MLTVVETETFIRNVAAFWSEEDRNVFIQWIAANPTAGDLIVGTGGLRKVPWGRSGAGKRGGVRIITYAALGNGEVWLLTAYNKVKFDNLPTAFLNTLKKEIDNG